MSEPPPTPRYRETLPRIDRGLVDRMLDGELDSTTVPMAYRPVLDLLNAARGPAADPEVAGEAAAVGAFLAQRSPGRPAPRRRMAPTAFTVKAAVATLAAASVVGVAAAAADHSSRAGAPDTLARPAPATSVSGAGRPAGPAPGRDGLEQAARIGLCEAAADPNGPESGPAMAALGTVTGVGDIGAYCREAIGSVRSGADPASAIPEAARPGLCRAYRGGQGVESDGMDRGGKATAAAFEALARMAGGGDKIAEYCDSEATRGPTGPTGRPGPTPIPATPKRHTPAPPTSDPVEPTTTPGHGKPTARPSAAPRSGMPPGGGGSGSPS